MSLARTLVAVAVAVALCGAAGAGETTHAQGDVVLQGGIGVGVPGWYGSLVVPPVSAVAEYGFHDLVSAGLTAGYAQSRYHYRYGSYRWEYKYSYTALGARVCLHPLGFPDVPDFPHKDRLDLYAGGVVGAVLVSHTVSQPQGYVGEDYYYEAGGSYPLFGAFLGARYYFSKRLAACLEMGNGLGWINAALALRL